MFDCDGGGDHAVQAGPLCLLAVCGPGSPHLPAVQGQHPGQGRQHGEHRQDHLQHVLVFTTQATVGNTYYGVYIVRFSPGPNPSRSNILVVPERRLIGVVISSIG